MADHYYVEVRLSGQSAVLLINGDGRWRLIGDGGMHFRRHGGDRGTWKVGASQMTVAGFYTDETEAPRFNMSDVRFPPAVKPEPDFLQNKVYLGDDWAKALRYRDATDAATSLEIHWYPVATGALMAWIKQYCAERVAELKRLAVTLSLNLGALVDPTGTLSLAGAIDASTQGDYLGCVLNLIGAVPLFGKASQAARNTQLAVRVERILAECRFLERWMQESKAILQRVGASEELKALRGAVGAAKGKVVTAAVEALENNGWIVKIDPKDYERLGMLAQEIECLQALARQGYYFVARACNPERVRWLTWAAKAGVRTLSKPLWVKAKSLKGAGFLSGLVGWKVNTQMMSRCLRQVAAPAEFSARFVENGGGTLKALYKIQPGLAATQFELKNASMASSHYIAEVDGFLILVDAKGAAYVSDLDVVLVQKRLPSGSFGPPGQNVGRDGIAFKGGDNADLRSFWNDVFGKVHYPLGYEVIQHGEATGTAGNFKKAAANFASSLGDVREPVWNPGFTWKSEELIVAVLAPRLTNGVGFTKGWEALKQFHRHNPMGEFRIPNTSVSH